MLAFAHLSSVVLVSKKWFWFRFVLSMPERSQFRIWAGGNPLKASTYQDGLVNTRQERLET